MQLGLQPPSPPQQLNIGGLLSVKPLKTLLAEEATKAAIDRAARAGAAPVVQGLAAHIKGHWSQAKQAKQQVEREMLEAVRARAGRYSADMEQKLAAQGGSAIYMMLFATKARQAKALLGDVMLGAGTDKPWTISPSPKPDIPEEDLQQLMQSLQETVAQAEMGPEPLSVAEVRQLMTDAKDRLEQEVMEQATTEAGKAEIMLADLLVEGGYQEAINEFLDDLTVFKTAFLKGPVIRNEKLLTWQRQADGTSTPVVTDTMKMCWERVDPFMMYPAGHAKGVQDAYLFERHRLSRSALSAMIGVEGYNEDAIRAVLDTYGTGGTREWLSIDNEKDSAEGRDNVSAFGSNDLIDALQYWGSVSGKMLREWGMEGITDDAQEYPVECWQVGEHTIKCVLNPDPLHRRPYYGDGYSRIPGAFWHNSLYDTITDCVNMCNAAARALANNLGISSGPQVAVNIDRMAPGEEISEMHPWKIWQFSSDPMGSGSPPISFFQPSSNVAELMGIYEKFSLMADEYSGIPRYMTGTEGTPGAGRTASGLSMMVGNASKVIKSLVSSLDIHITQKNLRRTFDLKIQTDPTFNFRGDLQIVPRGALSLTVKETANQMRMNFLQQTANPLDLEIIGIEGRANVLREVASGLNMATDKVVPSLSTMRIKRAQALQAQRAAAQAPPPQQGPQGPAGPQSGQVLADGSPMVDTFSPQPNA